MTTHELHTVSEENSSIVLPKNTRALRVGLWNDKEILLLALASPTVFDNLKEVKGEPSLFCVLGAPPTILLWPKPFAKFTIMVEYEYICREDDPLFNPWAYT